MNPFVKKVSINNLNKVEVYGSPDINISVLSAGKVASREADVLIYDEGLFHKFSTSQNQLIIKCHDYEGYHVGDIKIIVNDAERENLIKAIKRLK